MKKLFLMMMIILSVAVICSGKTTDPNKWDGFRDLKWRVDINDINDPNMIFRVDVSNDKIYQRITDKLSIGKAKLTAIGYTFYKDKFYAVLVLTKESQNFRYLKDAVFAYFGEGYQENEFIEKWLWGPMFGNCNKDVIAILDYNEFSEKATFTIAYMPIYREKMADEKKAAKEAESDF